MKKNTKKTIIILTIIGIFVCASLFSVFSNSYRVERIKLYLNTTVSYVLDNK